MRHRIVICTGGRLGAWALEHMDNCDLLIAADSGAEFVIRHGYKPDIAIGDFDSVTAEQLELIRERSGRMIQCDPVDKDYTDTEMAFRLALDMNPRSITLLGALGTRFDHSLSNVHLLSLAASNDVEARIVDEYNVIRLITETATIRQSRYTHLSLLPLSEEVTGITLTGFQYPLEQATLAIGQSLGISNVLLDEEGIIELSSGKLLLVQSRD